MERMPPAPRAAYVLISLVALVGSFASALMLTPTMPRTALATALAGASLAGALFALAFPSRRVRARLGRHSAFDLSSASHAWAMLLLVGGVFLIVVYGSLVGGVAAFESEVVMGEPAPDLSEMAIVSNVLLSALLFIIPAWVYVRVVHAASPGGAWRLLGMAPRRMGVEVIAGVALAGAFLAALALVGSLMDAVAGGVPENERALEIARSVSVTGALVLAAGAALGEEIFFRGFLQPRIGVLGQALVFMSGHLAYLDLAELVVTFVLALAFGAAYRRFGSLVAPIVAHFLFNAVMLIGARFAL